ncbi:tRNA lysidine(34) synthetase TilS [Candidatus Magnetomonas plexicatena]|uniref:tRNA lysidine(34) synthetase TilS n=1 Tax=Candidatus Magnetomonas plexicatena TaxID=2552947 RepID=UPI001C7550A8|nr:tRNA lysidine(34) synthetase TilS [Nitrospirales bacterium LBB_01]
MATIAKVRNTILLHSMLNPSETVLVGLSGGADSVCLLHVLKSLNLNLNLHTLYVDHRMRPQETPAEIEFCTNLCKSIDIPFEVRTIADSQLIKHNKQETLRNLRYQIFEDAASELNASKVALGHNMDDQAETILINLLRGSGMKGLSGIPPVRGTFIRPIIALRRYEIEHYLKSKGISFITDSSNLKSDYLRNKVRLSLIPYLAKEFNSEIVQTLVNTGEIIRCEDSFMSKLTAQKTIALTATKTDTTVELFLLPLGGMETAILRRTLRTAINSVKSLRRISYVHIYEIIKLIKTGKAGDCIVLPSGVKAIKGYSTVRITTEQPVKIGSYELSIPGSVIIKETGVVINASVSAEFIHCEGQYQICLDASKINENLTVRARMPGDFFYPKGVGGKRKLQDFFVDEKIHRHTRDSIPLILSGQDLIWVAGLRADERYSVSDDTTVFLKLEMTATDG